MAEASAIRQPSEIPSRPKMVVVIESLDAAQGHMHHATRVLSSMIMDLEKGADFIGQYRDSLIKTIETTGGDVTASIESQIKEFIPKNYRRAEEKAALNMM